MYVRLTGFLLLFSRICQCEQQFDVLKFSNVPFPHSKSAVALINAGFKQDIAEFTVCYRVLVESYNDANTPVIVAWKPGIEDYTGSYEETALFVDSMAYLTRFDLDGLQASLTYLVRDIHDGGIGNRSFPV